MKKKFIACVVACAMLLMGTGYAYWTDLLNVTATAETGKLDVNFTSSAKYVTNNFEATKGADLKDESAYDKTTHGVTTSGDNISISINDLYPGHFQEYAAEVDNDGTVAAKLSKVAATVSGDCVAKNMIGVAISATQSYDKLVHHGCWIFGWDQMETQTSTIDLGLPAGSTFQIGTVTFVRLSALKNLTPSSNLLYITNNSKMNFKVLLGMDPDASGNYTTGSSKVMAAKNDSDSQDKTAVVTLGFTWDQYNQQ